MAHPAAPTASDVVQEVIKAELGDADITASLLFIGGQGGSQYQVRGWPQGKLVKRLRIYSGYWQIKAVRIWLSGDGEDEYQQFGDPEDTSYAEFKFEDGERVTSMSLWGNGAGSRAGWISFETDKNRSFSYGMNGWPRKEEYPVDVGSGILVGAIYNAGSDIDAHGYYFLSSSITSTQVANVTYPTLEWDSSQIAPITLDAYDQTNTSSDPISWSFSGSRTVSRTNSWTLSLESSFDVQLSIEAGVPEVAKVGTTFGWKLGVVTTHQSSEESSHQLSWSIGGTLQPNRSIHLVALTRQGNLSIPYSSTILVTLKNGASFSFPLSGTYTGLSYTGVEVTSTGTS